MLFFQRNEKRTFCTRARLLFPLSASKEPGSDNQKNNNSPASLQLADNGGTFDTQQNNTGPAGTTSPLAAGSMGRYFPPVTEMTAGSGGHLTAVSAHCELHPRAQRKQRETSHQTHAANKGYAPSYPPGSPEACAGSRQHRGRSTLPRENAPPSPQEHHFLWPCPFQALLLSSQHGATVGRTQPARQALSPSQCLSVKPIKIGMDIAFCNRLCRLKV